MTTDQENTKERQEERWTARLLGRGEVVARYLVVDKLGLTVAVIEVPPTDFGRSTVAKMVAALQMEQAHEPNATPPGPEFLLFVADRLVLLGDDPNADFVQALRRRARKARAALEAAKRLP